MNRIEPRGRGARSEGLRLVLDQRLDQPVGEQPGPAEVGPEHQVELRGADLQQPVGGGDADVVDHQLDRPVAGQLVGHPDDVLLVQVGLDDLAALGAEGLLEVLGVPVDHGDVGPGHDQPLGDRLADAPGGAGDDGPPALEILEELADRRHLVRLTGIVVTVRLHAQLTSPPGRCVPLSKSLPGAGAVSYLTSRKTSTARPDAPAVAGRGSRSCGRRPGCSRATRATAGPGSPSAWPR